MKRQRGRGRKPGGQQHHHNGGGGGHQPNRTLESSGPDIKVRGPAAHIYERYLQLARDASSAGDRVMAENYLQHAEHYFRVLRAMQPATPPPQQQTDRFGNDLEYEDDEGGSEGGEGEAELSGDAADQPDVEYPQGGAPQQGGGGQQNFNRNGGPDDGFRRRRGRRNRFRPGGEEGGPENGPRENGPPREASGERPAGEQRPPVERQERPPVDRPVAAERSEPREPRERRPARERPEGGGEQAGGEGFSTGPKPAFLGSD
ncbi:MAG: DUF4167 domain-containing protein [Terricaulis sp.]